MGERWVANKFGLFNFWYYDEQEFQLLNGKILLRGSNGSGKSVTTQSFIPLLLDGNKHPRRLDPFGSTARRMENYLIHDDYEDRISYLYIEFKKPESDIYITIGMGMRAQKSKNMDSWYFILKDGRRVNKDFKLYKQSGEKYPLSKKEFKNRLGEGNFYTESQKEYMQKVNEHLFGYSDIENYEQLLNLLIELRSPKLSKDFKPTRIYEILKSSLKTLSEDDLRPMAEAMDNMDSLNTTMDNYYKSLQSAENIKRKFDNYNKYILYTKAKDFVNAEERLKKFINETDRLKEEIKTLKELCKGNEVILGTLKEELESANIEYEEIRKNDMFAIKDKVEKLKKYINENQEEYEKHSNKLTLKQKDLKEKEGEIQKLSEEVDSLYYKLEKDLDEAFEIGQEFYFEEAYSLKKDILQDVENYDFKYIKESLNRYEKTLKECKKLIDQFEGEKLQYEEEQRLYDEAKRELKSKEEALNEAVEYLTNIKEEYVGKANFYNQSTKEFKLGEETLQTLFKNINKIETIEELGDVNHYLKNVYNEYSNNVELSKLKLNEKIKNLESKVLEVEGEIESLKREKEIEFFRDEEVEENRKKLLNKNIPFIPFYRAFDFKEDVSEEERKVIEKALLDMGLLDTLIIPSEYRNEGFLDESKGDKYLWPIEESFAEGKTLKEYFTIEEGVFADSYSKELLSILNNIYIDEENHTQINKDGTFNIGIIKGKIDLNYELKYLGEESRRRHRERLIEENLKVKEELKKEVDSIAYQIKYLNEKLSNLEDEFNKFPNTEDLRASLKEIEEYESKVKFQRERLLSVDEDLNSIKKKIENIKKNIFDKTEDIQIERNSKAYDDAIDALNDYKNRTLEINEKIHKIRNKKSIIKIRQENIEELQEGIYDVLERITKVKNILDNNKIEFQSLNKVLINSNLGEIEKAMEKALSIRENHPQRIQELSENIIKAQSNIVHKEEGLKEKEGFILKEEKLHDIIKYNLEKEISLAYVKLSEEDSLIKQSKYIINNYKAEDAKELNSYLSELFESIQENEGNLREYSIKHIDIFSPEDNFEEENLKDAAIKAKRIDIVLRYKSRKASLYNLTEGLKEDIEIQKIIISDKEREIFEETLINTISSKITSKIYQTNQWVNSINNLMEAMDTSSGIKFSLKWKAKRAENENQLDIAQLVNILEIGERVTEEDIYNLSNHFKEKLKLRKRENEDMGKSESYQAIIKDILDYREWYEFILYFSKPIQGKKELTDNEFFTFSGGEKAMAMYVPLFAAVNARYNAAGKKDCPRIIALDEAFAGVDEKNINDMFKLIESLDLDYVLNSQVLWGDYESVKNLAIYQLTKDGEDDFVTVEAYEWNGKEKVCII